jgi:hypothetical protein
MLPLAISSFLLGSAGVPEWQAPGAHSRIEHIITPLLGAPSLPELSSESLDDDPSTTQGGEAAVEPPSESTQTTH